MMSKELPYFKFIATEWLTKDIAYESYEMQGMFIKLCAEYWNMGCMMTLKQAEKRISIDVLTLFDSFIVKQDENIKIKFLDEQWQELMKDHLRNVKSGKKGAKSRWDNSTANSTPIDTANSTPVAYRKDKIRKEEVYRVISHLSISLKEHNKLLEYWKDEQVQEIYDSIANHAANKKYKSLYLTAKNWLKRQYPMGKRLSPLN